MTFFFPQYSFLFILWHYCGGAFYIKEQIINLTQITFEVTDKCNLSCQYCAYGELYNDYDVRDNCNLKFDDAKTLIDYISAFWYSDKYPSVNKKIAIGFYGGEPLLNIKLIKKIICYLENIKPNHLDFYYVMTTNGILLDKHIDYLISKNFMISISFDGNRSNNDYRTDKNKNNRFEVIYRNAKNIQKNYNDFFNTNINFLSVLHNKNSVSEIVGFIKSEFNKIPSIAEVNPTGIRNDKIEDFRNMFQNMNDSVAKADNLESLQNDLFTRAPDIRSLLFYLHTFSGNVIRDYSGFFIESKKRNWLPTGTCVPFSKKIFLKVNGKILPCERIGHQFYLGKVEAGNITLDFEYIAKLYNGYYDKLKKQCSSCYQLKGCLLCIFNIESLESTLNCNQYMGINRLKKNLIKNVSLLEEHNELYFKIMDEVTIE
jgi:uncharacterized protein